MTYIHICNFERVGATFLVIPKHSTPSTNWSSIRMLRCIKVRLHTMSKSPGSFLLCTTLMISVIVVIFSREFHTIVMIPITSIFITNQSISSGTRVSFYTKCVLSSTVSNTQCRVLDIRCVTFKIFKIKVFLPFDIRLNTSQSCTLMSPKSFS